MHRKSSDDTNNEIVHPTTSITAHLLICICRLIIIILIIMIIILFADREKTNFRLNICWGGPICSVLSCPVDVCLSIQCGTYCPLVAPAWYFLWLMTPAAVSVVSVILGGCDHVLLAKTGAFQAERRVIKMSFSRLILFWDQLRYCSIKCMCRRGWNVRDLCV